MTEAITTAAALTPIGAVLVLAALAQVAIVQLAKQQSWTKTRTQRVSLAVATVLGAAAALVLGMIAGVPDSVVQAVSAILLSVAAVAVLGQALYKVIGYAVPDGADTEPTHRADERLTVNGANMTAEEVVYVDVPDTDRAADEP